MAYIGENCELPRFEGLGFLVGDTDSFALDVSGDGRVVVGRSSIQLAAARIETPFYWTHETGIQPLVTFPGRATATNSDGSVVVGTRAEGQAFRWIAGKGVTDLGVPVGGTSAAIGMSDDGAVVVGMLTDPAGMRAFRWTQANGLEPLDSTISSLTGVSRDGSLLVGSRTLPSAQAAFSWSLSGGFVDLTPAEATSTSAMAMSSDGLIVLGSGVFSQMHRVFRWKADQANVAQLLPNPTEISDAGNVVTIRAVSDSPEWMAGYVSARSAPPKDENQGERLGSACFGLADRSGASRAAPLVSDVATTLTSLGVTLDGWQLTRATAISADGTVLVGNGIDPDGRSQAWIARLP